jgi:aminoglycoside phosphotransferase (APT) family kinase protein
MNKGTVSQGRSEVENSLRNLGLLARDDTVSLTPLGGGVSCDVWRVDLETGPVCVKRALPRLRVEADWRAPAERAASEVSWLRLVEKLDPTLVPHVLGEDSERHLFVMEYLPPDSFPVWKAQLTRGTVDITFAASVGASLARIHAATAGRTDIAARFANRRQFHALRIEPYLLHTASRHPAAAGRIRDIADGIESASIALMQGDISPKNILCGSKGPVFLDAETANYGDPAFDLAFCLNHLLLKCIWRPRWAAEYLKSFDALKSRYLAGVTWENASTLETRAARLLPALLLARIDGKSPVEYLTDEKDKAFVRENALLLLNDTPTILDDIRRRWAAALGQPYTI